MMMALITQEISEGSDIHDGGTHNNSDNYDDVAIADGEVSLCVLVAAVAQEARAPVAGQSNRVSRRWYWSTCP